MKQKKFVMLCLALALVLLLPHAVFADTAKSGAVTDTITWELTDDGVLYIRGTGEIPDYGDFYKSGNRASDPSPWELWHDEILEIVIEEGIARIGERAFACNSVDDVYGYYNLKKVTLPRTLESVGLDAFCDAAYYLEEVHAPSLLDWCEIEFEAETPGDPPLYESNPALDADLYVGGELLTGKVVFPKELTKVNSLTFANREGLTEVVLHDGVTELGDCCFQDSKDLRFVGLPEGLKAIPNNAFSRCESLDGIVIPESVEMIGYASFFDCKSLQSINVPAAVTKIEVGAFEGCDSLNAVHISDLDAWCHIEFETFFHSHPHFFEGASPVRYAKNLYLNGELVTEVVVPDDITVLSGSVFAGCESLQKVTLPEGLKTIGQAAFLGCTALTELRLPPSVEEVEVYAFGDCTSLETLYIESPSLIETEVDSYYYEAVWKGIADRILVPDSYGKNDVGTIFEEYTYIGKQDGYSVFETCKHAQVEEVWTVQCQMTKRCTQCGEVLESRTQHNESDLEEILTEQCQLIKRCKWCGEVFESRTQHNKSELEEVLAEQCRIVKRCAYCEEVLESRTYHHETEWIVTVEPTETSSGSEEERCVVCGVILRTMDIPRLEKSEESSEQAESSAEESSVVTSSVESSAPEDKDGFPVGAVVVIAVLILAAVGVAVWFVRKKAQLPKM